MTDVTTIYFRLEIDNEHARSYYPDACSPDGGFTGTEDDWLADNVAGYTSEVLASVSGRHKGATLTVVEPPP